MKKEFQDEFWSLLADALADANKNLQEKGPIVFNGQRPNEANYGISPQNPLCSTSLGGTEAYLQRLRTLDGRKFTWNRAGDERADCNGAKDIGMDKYQLYLDGHPYKILYFVPYVGESTDAPHGMKLISDNATEDVMPSARQDTLSQEVVEPATSVTKQPIKVKVRAKSVPKGTASIDTPIRPENSQSTKQQEPLELQNDNPIEENIETPKTEPTSNEVDQVIADIRLSNSEEENDTPQTFADEEPSTKPSRKKWKPILFSAIGVVLVAVVALLIIHFLPEKVDQQDINTIYGCPELYDVEFGTDIDAVDSLLEIEHNTIMPNPLGDDEPMITLKVDTEFELYGLPMQDFLCSFDDDKLEMVLFFFEKENVTYEQITKLYTKIYGQATSSDTAKTVWSGAKTTITIFNDSEDDVYVVRYAETPNLRFTMLSFDGAEIDPCGFMSDNYIFDKTASHYISSLQKDKDYSEKHLSAAGFASFSKYTLYPSFEYMGIETGYTAIAFDVDDSEKTIGVVSYLFYLNQQNAVDRIDDIKNALDQAYGQFDSCTYTSTYYSDMGIVDLTFNEAKSKISAGTQGIYNIQWKIDGYNITLGLTIRENNSYYDGSVAFSIPDPHEHEYTLKSETAATCEKDGKKEYVCDCGDSYSETTKATGHSYTGGSCTQPSQCSSCKKSSGVALGHSVVDGICSRCNTLQISLDNLQGTWIYRFEDDAYFKNDYIKIIISGSNATVYERTLDYVPWYGTVKLTSDGFKITGTYEYYDDYGTLKTNTIIQQCHITKFAGSYFTEYFGDTWYKQ